MRCNKARDYISQELDAVLPPAATGKLRDHLDACDECRSYREDLALGQRLIAATEPQLPDNFEWKLQLKLNQALQDAAGQTSYRWHEERGDRWAWLRNFGAATAVGLAAVLALAMFFGPLEQAPTPTGSRPAVAASDRRPLFQPGAGGLYRPAAQRMVSAGGETMGRTSGLLDRSWSGTNTGDLRMIQRLRAENQQLKAILLQYQRNTEMMRTRLDTSAAEALDLQHDQ